MEEMMKPLTTLAAVMLAITFSGMAGADSYPTTAPPPSSWLGLASCRADPPQTGEKDALPDKQSVLIAAIPGSYISGEVAILAFPGSSEATSDYTHPYLCTIAGDFKAAGHPTEWVTIYQTHQSKYENYLLTDAAVVPYSDPINPTATGYNDVQHCNAGNTTSYEIETVEGYSCLRQAYNRGTCYLYGGSYGPASLDVSGLYGGQGYCPSTWGNNYVTVCRYGNLTAGINSNC